MSSLAQQLKRLAAPQSQAAVVTRDRHCKSLLFDSKEAATIDRETFYAVGVNGLQELEGIDPSFQEFENTLFDEASKSLERSVLTRDVNARLDRKIGRFLLRLSPYFLLKPAQKAMEWMIHRFSIHHYNVDLLLSCVIPYHDTNIFVRVVQLLDLREETNKWHWLQPIQTPGVPLSRTTVITHCYKDPGFLQFVCELVPSAIKAHKRITTHSSDYDDPLSTDGEAPSMSTDGLLRVVTCFYCTAVVGAIECAKPVTEKFLSGILPYVLKGLKSKFSDYQASSYMITCQLAIKVKMKTILVDPIIRSICKHLTPTLAVEALSCVAILCHTQPIPEFPESAFQKLCTFSSTLSALELLSQAPNTRPLLKLVLTKLIHKALHSAAAAGDQGNIGEEEDETYWTLLEGIVQRVKLDAALTKEMIETLLSGYLDIGKELQKQSASATNLKDRTLPVVAAMERRYPEAMDLAIGTFMAQKVDFRKKNLLQELISTSVSASKHQVVSGTATTLILSLNHANPDVRVLGVQHLKDRIASGEVLEEFCIETLLQRLKDDKIKVVNASLEIGEALCKLLPQEKLFDILMGILRTGKMKTNRGLTSITLSLKLLTNGHLWRLQDGKRRELIPVILPYLFHQGSEEPDSENEIIDVIKSSTLQKDFKIFAALNRAYHVRMKRTLKSGESALSSKLIEMLAVNFAALCDSEQMQMIDLLVNFLGQPHPHQAFYSVLISFLLLRTLHHTVNKLTLASTLLKVLEKNILTMLEPGFVIVKSDDPLPQLNGDLSDLPSDLHVHLSALLMLNLKRQRSGSPLMYQSQIEATLWCLRGMVSYIKIPSKLKTETCPWMAWKHKNPNTEAYLLWLLHLMDLLTQVAGAKEKKVSNSLEFKNILANVIQEHLCTPDLLWNFLCLVLTMPFESPGTQLYLVSPFYMARCLHMGLTSAQGWADSAEVVARVLGQESEVFPSLLVVLSSELEPIRGAAIHCLQALTSSIDEAGSQTPYIKLAEFLVAKGDEIQADPEYVKQAVRLYFTNVTTAALADQPPITPTPRRKKKKSKSVAKDLHPKITCLNWLLVFIHMESTPRFLQRALLLVLSEVQNEHILSLLLDMMSKLLKQLGSRGCLNSDEAMIFESIIHRLKPDTVGLLQHCISDVLLALTKENAIREGMKSPQKMVLKQLTPAFFTAIPSLSLKQALLAKLFDQQVTTDSPVIAASIGRTLRKLPLDTELILTELDKLNTERTATSLREARTRNVKEPETYQWQRVTHVVELLQKKKLGKIEGVAKLVAALLAILSRCMEADSADQEQPLEYLKQLLLTTVLNICNQLSPDNQPLPVDVLNQEQFNIELVVQCIRTSDDPQTHRHALMLLATAAGLFPDHVLHNIMAIFTFMGANMLHRDDSYSFQVIIRTVQTVIPALIKASQQTALPPSLRGGVDDIVVMVMRVFVDAFPHIPEHRRLPLFTQLMNTVGEERYLARMLALLIGGYVIKGAAAMHPGDEIDVKGPGRSIDFWLELCQNFTPDVQITSLTELLEYVSTLKEDRELERKQISSATRRSGSRLKQPKDSSNQEPLFDGDPNVRARQMRQFRFTAVCFLPYVVSNREFVEKLSEVSREDADKLKNLLQRLLEVLLGYITQVAQSVHRNAGKETAKFWRALLHRTYDALDKVNALLPARIFIDVIASLLSNKLATIRRKAMELLNNKLQQHQEFFDKEQNERLLGLISGLLTIATATKQHAVDTDEVDVNRHTALFSLKLLCTLLGSSHAMAFTPVLEASVVMCEEETGSMQVQGSAMLCLAECVRCLKAHSIRYLPRLMPRLLELLSNKETIVSSDLHLLSAVTAVQKVTDTLPHFQSPYLVDLLLQICRLSDNSEDEKSQLNLRLKTLSHNLASTVAVRVLLPVFRKAYDKIAETHRGSIGPLMGILSNHLVAMDKTDMTEYQQQAVAFFLVALDYRTKHTDDDLADIEAVEGHVIKAMLTFVMKLSEASFRPMFLKVVDWASRGTAPKDRLLTLYRLSDAIADKLKSLFTLFAGQLVAKAADLLDLNNTMKTDKPFFEDIANSEEKSSLLLTYILDCMHKCFLYDKGGFVSKERFQRLMQPLVDQIENMQGSDDVYHDRVSNHLTPCIAQLLAASQDSATWQPLNYQVLLKTRHTSAKVRFAAMTVLQELHRKLAEDYLSLLPETIPFLAELMEDESVEVEQQCQSVVSELEKTLGEPLQKYF